MTPFLVGLLLGLAAAEGEVPSFVAPGARLEKLWGEGTFTEGPAHGPGGVIHFTDIGSRIMQYDPATGKTTVYREPSGKANGLDYDAEGRLVACEGAAGGRRRVTRTEKDGKVRTLAERWQGKRFNSPNDLTISSRGWIYFSDPRYAGDEKREIATESVYRIDPDGSVTQAIADVEKPNGVILSPDEKTLYVADNNPSGRKVLLAYPVQEDGGLGQGKILHDFGKDRGIDGMCVDREGNIYATAGQGKTAGVSIFDPAGKKVGFIPTPEAPTNCVFGDRDRKTLYITGGKSLYRIKLTRTGHALYWPK